MARTKAMEDFLKELESKVTTEEYFNEIYKCLDKIQDCINKVQERDESYEGETFNKYLETDLHHLRDDLVRWENISFM